MGKCSGTVTLSTTNSPSQISSFSLSILHFHSLLLYENTLFNSTRKKNVEFRSKDEKAL